MNTRMSEPFQNQTAPAMEPPKKQNIGPIVGIAIIVLLILVAGLYLWGERAKKRAESGQNAAQIQNAPDSKTDRLNAQGSSDSASSIEGDLSATDLNNLDEGASQAELLLQ